MQLSWHIMQQQRNAEEPLGSTAATASQSLVIDDEEDSDIKQQEGMHVHFARTEPSLTTHLTPVPLHFDPSRGKRGSFFPGHGRLASSGSSVQMRWQACQSHCLGLITAPYSTVSQRA